MPRRPMIQNVLTMNTPRQDKLTFKKARGHESHDS